MMQVTQPALSKDFLTKSLNSISSSIISQNNRLITNPPTLRLRRGSNQNSATGVVNFNGRPVGLTFDRFHVTSTIPSFETMSEESFIDLLLWTVNAFSDVVDENSQRYLVFAEAELDESHLQGFTWNGFGKVLNVYVDECPDGCELTIEGYVASLAKCDTLA